MAGEFRIKNGAVIVPLAGNPGYLVTVDSDGKLETLSPETFATSADLADFITTTEVASISAFLQSEIDSIVQEGTTIESTDGTINVGQNLLNFDLTVNDYIGATEVSSISSNLLEEIDLTNKLSVFSPFIINSSPEIQGTGPYTTTITKEMGNLIALDAAVSPYDDIEIDISTEWTSTQVGTFRLDLLIKTGQTITFDSSIEGIADLDIPSDGVASLLFDKPYGTTTWYVRQSV
jgi:hypothetical protein